MTLVLAVLASGTALGAVIHTERSLYQNILITEEAGQRCMKFSLRRHQRRQSCIALDDPRRMVFTYTRMMMAGLLLNPQPRRVLVIGLGGGTLPTALAELLPDSRIDVVEIDPAVVRMAKQYFGFQPRDDLTVTVQDARVFGRRAGLDGRRYELVFLDAFTADYIPEHLMTAEYLTETRRLLAPDGVLVANTFAISRLYDHESVTYEHVFGSFLNLKTWDSSNRVIIASVAPLPANALLAERADTLKLRLRPYGVAIDRYLRALARTPDWDRDARVLTDQYAPANLLRGDAK